MQGSYGLCAFCKKELENEPTHNKLADHESFLSGTRIHLWSTVDLKKNTRVAQEWDKGFFFGGGGRGTGISLLFLGRTTTSQVYHMWKEKKKPGVIPTILFTAFQKCRFRSLLLRPQESNSTYNYRSTAFFFFGGGAGLNYTSYSIQSSDLGSR